MISRTSARTRPGTADRRFDRPPERSLHARVREPTRLARELSRNRRLFAAVPITARGGLTAAALPSTRPYDGRARTHPHRFAVVLALLAVTDLLKPMRLEGADTGWCSSEAAHGSAGALAGAGVGLFLATYAFGIWGLRRWVLPIAWLYAAYVTTNLILFPFRTPQPPDAGLGYAVFGVVYAVLGIGGSVTLAVLLGRRRDALR